MRSETWEFRTSKSMTGAAFEVSELLMASTSKRLNPPQNTEQIGLGQELEGLELEPELELEPGPSPGPGRGPKLEIGLGAS